MITTASERKLAKQGLEKRLLKEGYIPVLYRLLQLTAQCSLIGSGNMTEPDLEEMKQLCGYYTRKGKILR
jgi:hypothetical protein